MSRTLDFLTSLISAILVKCSEQNAVTADLGRYWDENRGRKDNFDDVADENIQLCDVWLCIVCGMFWLHILLALISLQTGQLNEYTERKEMSSSVICMALGRVPAGEQRSRFLAVGLADNTIRIISLQPQVHYTSIYRVPAGLEMSWVLSFHFAGPEKLDIVLKIFDNLIWVGIMCLSLTVDNANVLLITSVLRASWRLDMFVHFCWLQ